VFDAFADEPTLPLWAPPSPPGWSAAAAKEVKGKDLTWHTPEGIAVKPLYTAEDVAGIDPGLPGFAPFTRGVRASMYAGRPWTIRQYAGFSTAEESNAFYRRNLKAGQKGLSVAFDLATHRGYDSDHPRVTGDVGKAGVAIDTIDDMKILFDGIPLDRCRSVDDDERRGDPDPRFLHRRGRGAGRAARAARRDHPERHPQGVHGPQHVHLPARAEHADHLGHLRLHVARDAEVQLDLDLRLSYAGSRRDAGAGAGLHHRRRHGICEIWRGARASTSTSSPGRLSFFFAIGMNFFMEIAKLRAARVLWHRVMTNLGAQDERSKMLRTHCQTSGVSLTEQDPYNNVMRTTIEAMAAMLGGTQSLHTNALDEAIALPTDFSARIARNTQIVIQEETGHDQCRRSARRLLLCREPDPGAGRQGLGDHREGRGRWRHGQGRRRRLAQGDDRGGRRRRAARSTGTEEVIVGVNKYKLPRRIRSTSSMSTITPCARRRSSGSNG
jgi:methylmalonyl-CoA mutase